MRILTLALLAAGAMAETSMIEIPDSLKNPGRLPSRPAFGKPTAPALAARVHAGQPAAQTCSVPLTEVPLRDSRIRVIRPRTHSQMPVVATPAPPCEAEKR